MKPQNHRLVIDLVEHLIEINHRLSCHRNNPTRLCNAIQDVININTKKKNELLRGLPDEAFQVSERKRIARHSISVRKP